MSIFTKPLETRELDVAELESGWSFGVEVTESYQFLCGSIDIKVEEGTRSNYASIPQPGDVPWYLWILFFWALLPVFIKLNWLKPNDPRWSQAAVMHDDLYEEGRIPKVVADALFFDACITEGTPRKLAWLFFIVLLVAGGGAWERARDRDD